jgi:hypothetical protein
MANKSSNLLALFIGIIVVALLLMIFLIPTQTVTSQMIPYPVIIDQVTPPRPVAPIPASASSTTNVVMPHPVMPGFGPYWQHGGKQNTGVLY